ncbi:MAG: hypothetical protein LBT21_01730 [Oscillospiraceae bacterium]|nr:hypothetical protein [Oscillospiraceae bacterium]
MLNQSLYPAIFTRKSIRKWADTPLSAAQLKEVQALIDALVPLFPNEPLKLELKPRKDSSKYRIYAYCENTIRGNVNVGYALQQLDLAAHNAGLGSLWFGMGREPSDIKDAAPLSYSICMKIGNADEPIARKTRDEFSRRGISEVIADRSLQGSFEAVRLAPSASNTQPAFFVKDGDSIHVFCQKLGLIKARLYGKMNQVDVGIALCHAVLALEHDGYAIDDVSAAEIPPADPPAGCYYIATVRIRAD